MTINISLAMMVKNESKRLLVSLQSVLGYVNSLIIYDTGSTDNTIEILHTFSTDNGIVLRLKQGEFVDFSTSRNVLLQYADTFMDVDYLLLLDCNDELRGGELLINILEDIDKSEDQSNGFSLCQQWKNNNNSITEYFNIRLIKTRSGWEYKGLVHEWLENTLKTQRDVVIIKENIQIFQDKTQDDDKSFKRFERDLIILLKEFEKNKEDTRTIFYLAQTYGCLQMHTEAVFYYKLRSTLNGFQEEKFHSMLRLAKHMKHLGIEWEEIIGVYLKAYNHSNRLEPIIKIIEYYNKENNWLLSYTFCKLALKIEYPINAILFVDTISYKYKRFHLLGICAFYIKKYKAGKKACLKAIEAGINVSNDTKNLEFYP